MRGDEKFNKYILTKIPITKKASEITGLKLINGKLYYGNKDVGAEPISSALKQFTDFLQKSKHKIIIGHNIHTYDCPVLFNALVKCSQMDVFTSSVSGYIDTLKLFKVSHTDIVFRKELV